MATEYMRVYEDLRSRIQGGEFPEGGRLPGITALEEHYSTSLTTIRTAQQMLVDDGFLSTEQGRGAFVLSTHPTQPSNLDAAVGAALEQLQHVTRQLQDAQRESAEHAFGSVVLQLGEGRNWQTLPNALAAYAVSMRAEITETPQEDSTYLDPREEEAESAEQWIAWLRAHERDLDRSMQGAASRRMPKPSPMPVPKVWRERSSAPL